MMKIHHVGIVCKNIERAIKAYKRLFNVVEQSEVVYDELQKASLCLLRTDTGLDVEFISGEQVTNLVKAKITYYHLCYEVSCLEDEIDRFLNGGAVMVSEPKPAILFAQKRVAFLMTSTGLIELVEE